MKHAFPFLVLAAGVGLTIWLWMAYRRFTEREREAEQRMSAQMAEAMSAANPRTAVNAAAAPVRAPAPALAPAADLAAVAQQKLLYEAATKAAEAGEAVLSIQLYARLIARYPDSALGAMARSAVEAQKKKLVVKS